MMQPGEGNPRGKVAARRRQAFVDRDVDQGPLQAARCLFEGRRVLDEDAEG
jgi:hypothetical protein